MTQQPGALPQVDLVSAKMEQLRSRLRVVSTESVSLRSASGRFLARDIQAFRDSPAIDVSAMDGYAVRLDDLDGRALPLCGTATAGSEPIELKPGYAVRVFTGGPVPAQAQCVVRREDCNESETYVSICSPKESLVHGQNIRRQGENALAHSTVLLRGELLTPNRLAGAVTFLQSEPIEVHRKVCVVVINTGDELIDFGQPIEPWQIRDSNGPFLEAMLERHAWIEVRRFKVQDQPEEIEQMIRSRLTECDVMLLTGGVSMGDTDYVPDAIQACGGQVVFHRIPIRPGKPMLGAAGPGGQLILGLPGNPLSVAVTFRRFAMPLIQCVAGAARQEPVPVLAVESDDPKTIDLTWFRLVCLATNGRLSLVPSQGSGDIASLVQSDGFVEIPPNTKAGGNWPYYAW